MIPQITPVLSEEGDWVLYARTRFGLDIAGPRLFRAAPWPEVQWRNPDEQSAQTEATKLQRYLDEVYAKKGPSKSKIREAGE